MRAFLHIDELEVEASALVRQLGEILPQETALSPVQLLVTMALNYEHRLFPKLSVSEDALALLNHRKLTILFLQF